MAYREDGFVAFLPAGQKGMVNHENRLLSQVDELLTASGVSFEDDHIRREAGATPYDTSGLATAPFLTATASTLNSYAGALLAFPVSGSVTARTAVATTSSSGTLTITVPGGGYSLGDLVVVVAAGDELGVSSISEFGSDSRGNTYTVYGPFQGIPSTPVVRLVVYYSKITTALSAGDTVEVFVNAANNSTAVMGAFSNTTSGVRLSQANSNGVATALTVGPTGPVIAPVLLVGGFANGSTGAANTYTIGSSFTEDLETSSGQRDCVLAYRVDTSSPTIIALTDFYAGAIANGGGTVATTAGSTTVTGTTTTFTSHNPGDQIIISNETRVINTITSNTVLDTTEAWVTSHAGGSTFRIRDGRRIIIATTGGNLFRERPLTLTSGDIDAVTLKSGLSLSARPGKFTVGGKEAAAEDRKLFYYNGVNPIQVLAGSAATTADITGPASDWGSVADANKQPIGGTIHRDYHVVWGNLNDPHRVYRSNPDDHEDFNSADSGSVRLRSDIGDRIFCGISFQGIFYVWKYPRGIVYIDDSDLDPLNWVIRTKSEALGCAPSPYAALAMDDDVVFMAADGAFHLLSAVQELGGVKASNLTRALGLQKWFRENLNLERLNQVVSIWYPHKKIAEFAVPGVGEVENSLRLRFDFGRADLNGGLPRFSYSERDRPAALAVRVSQTGGPETPILGEAGFVFLMDDDETNKNGNAYSTQYQTPHLDFGDLNPQLRHKKKIYDRLEILFEPADVSGTIDVDVYVDGTLRQTLEDIDVTERRQERTLHVGDGYMISLRVTNENKNEDFKILGMMLYFRVGNESKAVSV